MSFKRRTLCGDPNNEPVDSEGLKRLSSWRAGLAGTERTVVFASSYKGRGTVGIVDEAGAEAPGPTSVLSSAQTRINMHQGKRARALSENLRRVRGNLTEETTLARVSYESLATVKVTISTSIACQGYA